MVANSQNVNSSNRLRPSLVGKAPGRSHESALWGSGRDVVVGIDEVGRGAWAGPLTVGAVVIPHDRIIYKIRDSKRLSENEREAAAQRIKEWAVEWSVGHVSSSECDELGMSEAQKLAAFRALEALETRPDHVLVDGPWDFIGELPTTPIVRGDSISLSIAAASIVAKVTRDRILGALDHEFPWFSLGSNKGYPCSKHRAALQLIGPATIHRRSWSFMEKLPWSGVEGCDTHIEPLTLF